MSSKLEGFPAILYTGLWALEIFGKLKKDYKDEQMNLIFLVTDSPPATLIKIDKGSFEIQILDEIKEVKDLENIDCDAYLALTTDDILGGITSIMDGIAQNRIKLKNPEFLRILGKILEVL